MDEKEDKEEPNLSIGRDVQLKFDFYFVALVFTILGLSVQISSSSDLHWQRYCEFFAWIALLISGMCGLFRLANKSVAYRNYGSLLVEEANLRSLKSGRDWGRSIWGHTELSQSEPSPNV